MANVYRYPGDDWPFVLPATGDEFTDDIRRFEPVREPKFELVHDPWLTSPLWQFALRTDAPRAELEELFPGPYGSVLVGLEDIFRVVGIPPPWPGLGIRLDLYYRFDGAGDLWSSGEWLVTEGGRLTSDVWRA